MEPSIKAWGKTHPKNAFWGMLMTSHAEAIKCSFHKDHCRLIFLLSPE